MRETNLIGRAAVEITDFERAVGRYVQDVFGSEATARFYGDDYDEFKVAVLHGPDHPVRGVTSYSTVGLSNFQQDVNGTPVRVEVVSAAASRVGDYALAVSSCFFEHVRNSTNIIYGTVIPNILGQYDFSPTVDHFTFVSPFLWPELHKANIGGQDVRWLYALPITEAERRFLEQNGIDALEDVFEACQADHYDLFRESLV